MSIFTVFEKMRHDQELAAESGCIVCGKPIEKKQPRAYGLQNHKWIAVHWREGCDRVEGLTDFYNPAALDNLRRRA